MYVPGHIVDGLGNVLLRGADDLWADTAAAPGWLRELTAHVDSDLPGARVMFYLRPGRGQRGGGHQLALLPFHLSHPLHWPRRRRRCAPRWWGWSGCNPRLLSGRGMRTLTIRLSAMVVLRQFHAPEVHRVQVQLPVGLGLGVLPSSGRILGGVGFGEREMSSTPSTMAPPNHRLLQ